MRPASWRDGPRARSSSTPAEQAGPVPDQFRDPREERLAAEARAEEERFAEQERRSAARTRRQILRWIVTLVLAAVALYVVGPTLVEVFSSAPHLRRITWWWFPIMFVLQAASLAALWAVQWISIRHTRWWPVIASQLAGNAFGRVVPGGGAAATALQYRMLVDDGTPPAAAATGLTAANLLTFGVLLGLPLLAVPAILQGTVPRSLRTVIVWALMVLVALAAGAVVLIVTDRPLRWLGVRAQQLRNRLRARRPPLTDLPDRLVRERDLIVEVVGERWKRALGASVGKWLLDFAVLMAALSALGQHPALSLALLAYFAAQLLAQIPLTPGGLGFVEAGLTGTLALIGVTGGDAVLATLAYRLFSYWLPVPFGGVAWLLFRRRHPEEPPLIASG
jgi:uncharacterized protein (TIRG00374 family)